MGLFDQQWDLWQPLIIDQDTWVPDITGKKIYHLDECEAYAFNICLISFLDAGSVYVVNGCTEHNKKELMLNTLIMLL